MQLDYQEFNFFMDRYKQVVFGYITNDLYEYADILDVKAGPFKDVVHYNLSTATGEMEVVHEQVGPSKYDNLNNLIARVVDIRFYEIVKKYAVNDCDFQYCRDCADELVDRLKKHLRLY